MTTPTPTAWFLARNPDIRDGRPTAAARSFDGTRTQRYDPKTRSWVDTRMFFALGEDAGWENVGQAEVDKFIASL